MKLYGYFRSSTSYRVRIALNLKGIEYETVTVNLLSGAQRDEAYQQVNPFCSVPLLDINGVKYSQSMAILAVLDELFPEPALLPYEADRRRLCRELSYAIATEIHSPNNLKVLKYLRGELCLKQDQIDAWYSTWVRATFEPIEMKIRAVPLKTLLPFGEWPGLFECVLIPQIYNARRFGVDLSEFQSLLDIEKACLSTPAFVRAHPDNQPDSLKA